VGDLECELRKGETGIPGARSDPKNACIGRWTVGVQPEAGCAQRGLGTREAQSPKSNVVTLARAVIDCLLETDVLAANTISQTLKMPNARTSKRCKKRLSTLDISPP